MIVTRWQENKDLNEKAAQAATAKEREAAEKSVETLGGEKFDILGFYVTPGEIRRGDDAQLCYGVSNAKSVTIDPPDSGDVAFGEPLHEHLAQEDDDLHAHSLRAQGNKKSFRWN